MRSILQALGLLACLASQVTTTAPHMPGMRRALQTLDCRQADAIAPDATDDLA